MGGYELLRPIAADIPQLQFFLLFGLVLSVDDVGIKHLFILHGGGRALVAGSLHFFGLKEAVFLRDDGQTVSGAFLECLLAVWPTLSSENAAHYINIMGVHSNLYLLNN